MENRITNIVRTTKETDINLTLNLDGTGKTNIHTGVGFFDHMLDGFARHGLFDLDLQVVGDLHVDCHHTVEDVGRAGYSPSQESQAVSQRFLK